jgi:hypothetical protein
MKQAAEIAQWSSDQVRDVFWNNAAEAFGIAKGSADAGHERASPS